MIRTIVVLLCVGIVAQPLTAQTADSPTGIQLANEAVNGEVRFHERYADAARISGAVLAGVQVRSPGSDQVELKVHIADTWLGKEMCARVVSADGLYESVNTYRIPPNLQGRTASLSLADVPFDTEYGERLSEAEENGLAIKATLGACDSGETSEATIAFWNNEETASVTLLINSFRASRVFVYIGDDNKPPVACTSVTVPARTAYDTVCSLEALPAGERVKLSIFRVRESGSTSLDEIYVETPGERDT